MQSWGHFLIPFRFILITSRRACTLICILQRSIVYRLKNRTQNYSNKSFQTLSTIFFFTNLIVTGVKHHCRARAESMEFNREDICRCSRAEFVLWPLQDTMLRYRWQKKRQRFLKFKLPQRYLVTMHKQCSLIDLKDKYGSATSVDLYSRGLVIFATLVKCLKLHALVCNLCLFRCPAQDITETCICALILPPKMYRLWSAVYLDQKCGVLYKNVYIIFMHIMEK